MFLKLFSWSRIADKWLVDMKKKNSRKVFVYLTHKYVYIYVPDDRKNDQRLKIICFGSPRFLLLKFFPSHLDCFVVC